MPVSGYLKTGVVNSKGRKGGIPDQKGVLELNRGFPEVSLILQNNKVWQGAVALHFWFKKPMTDKGEVWQKGTLFHHRG